MRDARRAADDDDTPAWVSVTAAAQRIEIGPRLAGGSADRNRPRIRKPESWQADAWDYFDSIGEVKFAHRFLSNSVGRVRYFPGLIADEDAPPVHVDDAAGISDSSPYADAPLIPADLAAAARVELARLRADVGGQPELIRQLGLNLSVAGEGYIVGRTVREPVDGGEPVDRESFDVYANDELQQASSGGIEIVEPGKTSGGTPLGADDFLLRVWRRHPRRRMQADSSMRAILDECEELRILSGSIRASGLSRNNAGVLLVPIELSRPSPTDADDVPVDVSAEPKEDKVTGPLIESMTTPISDPSSAAAVVPHVLRGKAEYLKEVRRIDLSREIDATAVSLRGELIERIAYGLDVPPEVITGKADVNHWTAWQIAEETYQAHVEPLAQLIADALAIGYLRPMLRAYGQWDVALIERVVLGLDPSNLVSHPNRAADAKDAHREFAISDEALRRYLGMAEADAPGDEELQRRLGVQRGILTAELTNALLKLGALIPAGTVIEPIGGNAQQPAADQQQPAADQPSSADNPLPAEPAPTEEPAAAAAAATPGAIMATLLADAQQRQLDQLAGDLVQIERELRTRLLVAADVALARALDRAGARLRTKAGRDRATADAAASVPENRALAASLGPAVVAALGLDEQQLLAGAFDELHVRWRQWTAAAQQQALAAIRRAGGDLDTDAARQLAARFDDDNDAGWLILLASLTALADRRLFAPDEPLGGDGEVDTTISVPAGIVREALARAGGAQHVGTLSTPGVDVGAGLNAAQRLLDVAGTPAGGLTSGPTVRELLAETLRARFTGYRWVYGSTLSRTEPFEPHVALSGVEFATFDDEQLAADAGRFPYVGHYYPGDHWWCQCDYVPSIGTAG